MNDIKPSTIDQEEDEYRAKLRTLTDDQLDAERSYILDIYSSAEAIGGEPEMIVEETERRARAMPR